MSRASGEPEAKSFTLLGRSERLIGSIRRERLDHVIVINAPRRVLTSTAGTIIGVERTLGWRRTRPITDPSLEHPTGPIVAIPEVGGLHHRCERRTA